MERTAIARLPTKWGLFQAYCYRSNLDGTEHVAVVKVMPVIQSLCLTQKVVQPDNSKSQLLIFWQNGFLISQLPFSEDWGFKIHMDIFLRFIITKLRSLKFELNVSAIVGEFKLNWIHKTERNKPTNFKLN